MTTDRPAKPTADTWMFPPPGAGWTVDQVRGLELPTDWELVDGVVVVKGMAVLWHNKVRDGVLRSLAESGGASPYSVVSEQCVLVDSHNVAKPDVIVYDERGLDVLELDCVPASAVALVVEVVSPGSMQDDRHRKPALFAAAGVPYYWRVERGEDDLPVVHEFWRHHDTGEYVSAPERPRHTGKLETDRPFPVVMELPPLLGR
ncbi:Uma2 family endonuclease [Streptomyces sp. NPDC059740]|uniref:Uma2 family endonuclease n=1 Tax=Streptomyces sp. NPDC059740 TaxID=3346926 RepID=UPI003660EB79